MTKEGLDVSDPSGFEPQTHEVVSPRTYQIASPKTFPTLQVASPLPEREFFIDNLLV